MLLLLLWFFCVCAGIYFYTYRQLQFPQPEVCGIISIEAICTGCVSSISLLTEVSKHQFREAFVIQAHYQQLIDGTAAMQQLDRTYSPLKSNHWTIQITSWANSQVISWAYASAGAQRLAFLLTLHYFVPQTKILHSAHCSKPRISDYTWYVSYNFLQIDWTQIVISAQSYRARIWLG